jgi:WD40 repeat protein
VFVPKDKTFMQTLLALELCTDEVELYEPMCGLAIIGDPRNAYYAALDVEEGGKRHMILTGHKDGKVMLWRSDAYLGVLHDFEEEISCMNLCSEGIVFCSWSGRIHFWDINLNGATRTIELHSLPFKLLNYNITGCDFNQNRVLVVTHAGDAVEITCV